MVQGVRITHQARISTNFGEIWLKIGQIWRNSSNQKIIMRTRKFEKKNMKFYLISPDILYLMQKLFLRLQIYVKYESICLGLRRKFWRIRWVANLIIFEFYGQLLIFIYYKQNLEMAKNHGPITLYLK